MTSAPQVTNDASVDVVVVGAGFAGLYAVHRLRADGWTVRCIEAGEDVGGTWFWNRYPGARCDVESFDYSYSFSSELEQEWEWSERYAPQPEILRYMQHVADRFDLRRFITFGTRVTSARYDEGRATWAVGTDRGGALTARFLVMATGPLSVANLPTLDGLEAFTGRVFHTGAWPHEPVDFRGRAVAVVGTGSSGIQLIPQLAEQAEHLFVLQRTPNFTVPARNRALTAEAIQALKAGYPERRAKSRRSPAGSAHDPADTKTFEVDEDERRRRYEAKWRFGGATFAKTFLDQMTDRRANDEAVAFVHARIDETVADPSVADLLKPTDHPIGAKRICVDTDYYATFNRSDVSLINLRTNPVTGIEGGAITLTDGSLVVDDIVFATGFDAMTGALARIDIVGRQGVTFRDAWGEGPQTYLGIGVSGFPNLFVLNGPGSPSVLANMVLTSEQQVDWVAGALAYLRSHELNAMEADVGAQQQWVEHGNALAEGSLVTETNSWYLGANIPGKPRVFMPYLGGYVAYKQTCDEVAEDGYRGFVLSAVEPAAPAVSSG